MQLFQVNQSEESSKITINAHTISCPLHQLPITTASTLLQIWILVFKSLKNGGEFASQRSLKLPFFDDLG